VKEIYWSWFGYESPVLMPPHHGFLLLVKLSEIEAGIIAQFVAHPIAFSAY
jgi:hypothetical protein